MNKIKISRFASYNPRFPNESNRGIFILNGVRCTTPIPKSLKEEFEFNRAIMRDPIPNIRAFFKKLLSSIK